MGAWGQNVSVEMLFVSHVVVYGKGSATLECHYATVNFEILLTSLYQTNILRLPHRMLLKYNIKSREE